MLSNKQKQAVEHINTPLMITAGPGTGKTQIIVHKIFFLLEKGYDEESILALSFTEKSAEELTNRIYLLTKKNIIAKTFHSFALEIIDEYSRFIPQISSKRKIIEESDSLYFFYENLDKFKISSIEIGNRREDIIYSLHNAIMKFKENGISIKNLETLKFENLQTKIDILSAYVKYEKYKNKNNFLDFSDLLLIVLNLFETNFELCQEIKNKFRYILIDEFQDTNLLQFKIINLLSNGQNLTVVGDYKQAIYGFRGANNSSWNLFKEKYLNYKEIFLDENYRSTKMIIDKLNLLISNPKEKLISNSKENGGVNLYECETEFAQEQLLLELLEKNEEDKIGIFFRTLKGLKLFSKFLVKNKIGHKISHPRNPFTTILIKELLDIIRVIDSPSQTSIELFNILLHGPVHRESLRLIMHNLVFLKYTLYEAILLTKIPNSVEKDEKEFLIDFVKNIELMRKKYIKKRYKFISELIEEIIVFLKLRERASKIELEEIAIVISYVEKLEETYDDLNIDKFLKIILMTRNMIVSNFKDNDENNNNNNIQLMTYHQAKGKEFDCVIMPTLNDRRLPLLFKKNLFETPFDFSKEEFLIEERNLFFVGLSRAKKTIYLSYVNKFTENKLPSKISLFLIFLDLEIQKYLKKKVEHLTSINNRKKELEDKLSRAILLENFSMAKKHLDLLEKISKKDNTLNSFILNKPKLKFETLYSKKEEPVLFDSSKAVYSVSQLGTYESCPKKYLYQYVYKVPSKPKHYFSFGNSMHKVLELLLPKFEIEKNEEKLYKIGIELMNLNWISKAYLSISQEEEYKEKGRKVIQNFIKTELKRRSKTRRLFSQEKRFKVDLWGKKFVGIIDRIDVVEGEYEILDYKTSNSKEAASKMQENMQLNVYAQAIKNEYGKYPKSAGLWYLIHDSIESIEIKEEAIESVRKKIMELIRGIENKNFEAKPSLFGCKFCDFSKICVKAFYEN